MASVPSQIPGPAVETRSVRDKLPFEKRVRLNIELNDPEFIDTEKYFAKMLRDHSLTIDQILKDHFGAHEIDKFIPTNKDPMATWQREDAVRYNELLNTRFKGGKPTLSFKMAMFYYGLPVAPMKMLVSQVLEARDFEDLEADRIITNDPLSFLDEQGYRTYEDKPSTADKQIYGPPMIQSLNLRGGELGGMETETSLSDMDDESSELWERQADDQLGSFYKDGADEVDDRNAEDEEEETQDRYIMYGREGNVECGFGLDEFVANACILLRVVDADKEVEIVVDLFERGQKGELNHLNSVRGPIYPSVDKDDGNKNSIVWQHMEHHMTAQHAKDGRVAFVRLPKDERPTAPEPCTRQDGLVRICRNDGVRQMVSYMRTPSRPTDLHSPSQYALEYSRTLTGLLPPVAHEFIAMRHAYSRVRYTNKALYARQDPDAGFIKGIAETFANGAEHTFVLETVEYILPVHVPVLLPEVQGDISGSGFFHPAIIGKTNIATREALMEIIQHAIKAGGSAVEGSIVSVEMWVPAESFQQRGLAHPVSEAITIPIENSLPTKEAIQIWDNTIKVFSSCIWPLYSRGFAILVRPIHDRYRFCAPSRLSDYIEIPSLTISLATFKNMMESKLFAGKYNQTDHKHVLRISQHDSETPYPIRFDTTEVDWTLYMRQITKLVLTVELFVDTANRPMEKDTRWDVDNASYWGPCYDVPECSQTKDVRAVSPPRFNLADAKSGFNSKTSATSVELPQVATQHIPPTLPKQKRLGPQAARSYGQSTPSMSAAMCDDAMRHQSYWDTPSIFSNPLKPVVPIHAPPLETVLRSGPSVPGTTLGMRTGTELAGLQNQIHLLRGQLMDRIRVCPYADCDKYFHYRDATELDEHLKKDHAVVECSFCLALGKTNDGRVPLLVHDPVKIMHHFYEEHSAHFNELFKTPLDRGVDAAVVAKVVAAKSPEAATVGGHFCHRCGRDEVACHEKADREHHNRYCQDLDGHRDPNAQKSTYCVACGSKRMALAPCPNKNCVTGSGQPTAGDYCRTCGFKLSSCSQTYKIAHQNGCRIIGGQTDDFCTHCGTCLRGLTDVQTLEHMSLCDPPPVVEEDRTYENDGGDASASLGTPSPKALPTHIQAAQSSAARAKSAPDRPAKCHTNKTKTRRPLSVRRPGARRDSDFDPGSSTHDETDDEDDDAVIPSDPVTPVRVKKRKHHSGADPTYIDGRLVEPEPEEEISTMGAPEEDYSVLKPDATEIPADFPSPIKDPVKKRTRKCSQNKTTEGATDAEPKTKRVRISVESKISTPIASEEEEDDDDDDERNLRKTRPKKTPGRSSSTVSPVAAAGDRGKDGEKTKPKTKATPILTMRKTLVSTTAAEVDEGQGVDELGANPDNASHRPKSGLRNDATEAGPQRNIGNLFDELSRPTAPPPLAAVPLMTVPRTSKQKTGNLSDELSHPTPPPRPTGVPLMTVPRSSTRMRKASAKSKRQLSHRESSASESGTSVAETSVDEFDEFHEHKTSKTAARRDHRKDPATVGAKTEEPQGVSKPSEARASTTSKDMMEPTKSNVLTDEQIMDLATGLGVEFN